jgi:hypothetical protein
MEWRHLIRKYSEEKILRMKERIEWWDDSMFNMNIIPLFSFSIILFSSSSKFLSTHLFWTAWTKAIKTNISILAILSSFHADRLFRHSQDNHNDMTMIGRWFKIRKQTSSLSELSRNFPTRRKNVLLLYDEVREWSE